MTEISIVCYCFYFRHINKENNISKNNKYHRLIWAHIISRGLVHLLTHYLHAYIIISSLENQDQILALVDKLHIAAIRKGIRKMVNGQSRVIKNNQNWNYVITLKFNSNLKTETRVHRVIKRNDKQELSMNVELNL